MSTITPVLAWGRYGLTPTILFYKSKSTKSTQEIGKRFEKVTAVSVHPGWIDSPFFKAVPEGMMAGMRASGQMLSWVEGAQTTLHCCLAPTVKF